MDYTRLTKFTSGLLEQIQPGKMLWHYTAFEGLYGILSSRKIRLSHPAYLSDPSELQYGQELTQGLLRGIRNSASASMGALLDSYQAYGDRESRRPPFVASFCDKEDELSLWRSYGDDGMGVALGFLISELRDGIAHQVEQMEMPVTISLYRVLYGRDELNRIVNAICGFVAEILKEQEQVAPAATNRVEWMQQLLDVLLSFFHPFLKHECYRSEAENRLVLHGNDVKYRDIGFTPRRGYLKPHIDVKIEGSSFPQFPLHTIRVGPAANNHQASESIRLLLKHSELDHYQIVVEQSMIPYRGNDR